MATNEETEQRLKSALWYAIGQIIDEDSLRSDSNVTPQFIGALTEMAWAQIETVAKDLECFAKHAGRTQISTDDVMLLARRNEGLESVMRTHLETLRAEKADGGARGGRR
ncbi:hypothetical protein BT63DRAFT_480056 [Microthyrium microscopicum]|uniref:Apoptosis-inducing TAF9-like domain 1 family protein n=1 Tax=Microthyrium microscopicum TaxID=703497 RepID=A0A6A6UB45_9PEZI|nr:hypothetical protein BT63DRAFT_480056 [Microthyrium microscopicum]